MAINTTFVTGAVLTAAQMNAMPFGAVGTAVDITTLTQTGITTAVDITGATITFTAISGRKYKVSFQVLASANAANTGCNIILADASTTFTQVIVSLTSSGESQSISGVYYFTAASSGSLTRKLRVQRQYGTGSITIATGAAFPLQFQIEDIGN